MWKYILRRFLYAIVTVWVISMIAFVVIQLPPGDYVEDLVNRIRSQSRDVNPEYEERLRQSYGVGDPVPIQYFKWIRGIVTKGNFGYSITYREDARVIIMQRLPISAVLALAAFLLIWAIALPLGIYSAVYKYTPFDYGASFISFVGLAIPNFVLALVLIYLTFKYTDRATIGIFSQEFQRAPWSWAKAVDLFKHLWIPAVVVAMSGIAGLVQTMRANLLDELNKPYVATARSKGLSESRLLWKYPVRIALNPFISTVGYLLPALVSGETITSIVLNLPTAGPIMYTALVRQDQFVAAGFILLLSVLTVLGTFISDLLLAVSDPRIRLQ
jgi:peptide/nickel transport system permease protein